MQEYMNKKLPLGRLLKSSLDYCNQNLKLMMVFVVVNYIICALTAYCWKTFWLWPLLVILYILWGGVFRYYFAKKPYLHFSSLFLSMIPSTKIVVLSVLVVSLFILLPIVVLFVPILPDDFMKSYAVFLQKSMQETDLLDAIINVVVVIFSPIIFYRPMMAWVAALIGRSGTLRFAWDKTKGNYWEFLLLAISINLSITLLYNGIMLMGGSIYIALIPISVLVVYFNIVIAKIYSFFFLS